MIVCPSSKCGSSNVADLPHYWLSLPAESPLKARYAPPPEDGGGALAVVAAIVLGIVALVSGAVLPGVLATLGGLGWGALVYHRSTVAQAKRAAWDSSQVCLACTGRF